MECGFDTHKNALINNLVILFDFFCAVESIYSFFQTDSFFWFNSILAPLRIWPRAAGFKIKIGNHHYTTTAIRYIIVCFCMYEEYFQRKI